MEEWMNQFNNLFKMLLHAHHEYNQLLGDDKGDRDHSVSVFIKVCYKPFYKNDFGGLLLIEMMIGSVTVKYVSSEGRYIVD